LEKPAARPVLAFDTSTAACSACVWREGRVLARRYALMARGQSEALMPMIAEVMAEAELGFRELGLIGVTVGPGAFTGLRIGLSAARALALSAGLPVAGVTTTEVAAFAVPEAERLGAVVLAAVESKRDEVYVQAFGPGPAIAPLGGIALALPAEALAGIAGPVVLAGDAAARVLAAQGAEEHARLRLFAGAGPADAAHVAALAAARHAGGEALPPSPLSLRAPDVTMAEATVAQPESGT
jgi:tRNA threonylcarbamoyladenosine biosynthesis protein TsaB